MIEVVDQQPPAPNDRPSIQSMVRADLEERERLGVERYGMPLQAHNGRNALVDAYQEALDLACYLRQAIEETAEPSLDVGDAVAYDGFLGGRLEGMVTAVAADGIVTAEFPQPVMAGPMIVRAPAAAFIRVRETREGGR